MNEVRVKLRGTEKELVISNVKDINNLIDYLVVRLCTVRGIDESIYIKEDDIITYHYIRGLQ